jgi:hypothetical protein
MKTTTIRLFGGILGDETMLVRCKLANASSPVEVDYQEGSDWEPTQYRAADARHSIDGLAAIGIELAQSAVQEKGSCEWGEVCRTYFLAFMQESDGTFEVVREFEAGSDDEANAWAESNYDGEPWYVLNYELENINA